MSQKADFFDDRPVGVFDSGLGGLTVTAELLRRFPDETFVYLGDTARVPYGDKSAQVLLEYARQDAAFLLSKQVKMIIAACNTVSSVAIPSLREQCGSVPVLGVIEAGVRAAADAAVGSVAVIGTRATVNSGAYERGIRAAAPGVRVESTACPLLVPLAEEGVTTGPVTDAVIDIYLGKYREAAPGALLLGCTHYPLFRESFERYFGGRVKIIDSATACAAMVETRFREFGGKASPGARRQARFYVTDLPAEFHAHAERFLGSPIGEVEKVSLC